MIIDVQIWFQLFSFSLIRLDGLSGYKGLALHGYSSYRKWVLRLLQVIWSCLGSCLSTTSQAVLPHAEASSDMFPDRTSATLSSQWSDPPKSQLLFPHFLVFLSWKKHVFVDFHPSCETSKVSKTVSSSGLVLCWDLSYDPPGYSSIMCKAGVGSFLYSKVLKWRKQTNEWTFVYYIWIFLHCWVFYNCFTQQAWEICK